MGTELFDGYLKAFNKTLSVSLFDHEDAPNYQLLSEGLESDGETSPFAEAFTDESPINELNPAENTAQTWMRKSNDKQSDLYFTNLYSAAFSKTPQKAWDAVKPSKGSRVPQGVDISSLTPQDEWDARFKKDQPFQDTLSSNGAAGGGLTSGKAGSGLTSGKAGSGLKSNPADSAQKVKPQSYADRTAFAKRKKMSPTDYYNFFRRTNAQL